MAGNNPGSTGSSGSSSTLIRWTLVAVIVAGLVILAAILMTKPKSDEEVAQARPIPPALVTPRDIPASGRTLGNPAAPVTIDIYEDFRCTGCLAYTTSIEPTVEAQYIRTGKAKLVFHDFLTIDRPGITESRDAANAALCAADQGKFWTLHDWLFANQSPAELPGYFTLDRLVAIGQAAGMDMKTFEPCVRNGSHVREVEAEQAPAAFSISFTPSIFVNGKLVVSREDPQAIPTALDIGAAIDAALKQSAGRTTPTPSPGAAPPAR